MPAGLNEWPTTSIGYSRLLQQNLPIADMNKWPRGPYVGACSCPRSHVLVLRDFIGLISSSTTA